MDDLKNACIFMTDSSCINTSLYAGEGFFFAFVVGFAVQLSVHYHTSTNVLISFLKIKTK